MRPRQNQTKDNMPKKKKTIDEAVVDFRLVERHDGYTFWVMDTPEGRVYNIIPECTHSRPQARPASGYYDRQMIERIKGVKFNKEKY